ncbi:heat-inducible transcription repressor [Wolffia australiana]
MNFLLRSTNTTVTNLPPVVEDREVPSSSRQVKTLEGLIAEDSFPSLSDGGSNENHDGDSSTSNADPTAVDQASIRGHIDVTEDNGWIIVPCKELPKSWSDLSDIRFFHSLDRQFVFPGEELRIIACLSTQNLYSTQSGVAQAIYENGNPDQLCKGTDRMETNINQTIERDGNLLKAEGGVAYNHGPMTIPAIANSQTKDRITEFSGQTVENKQIAGMTLEKFKKSHYLVRIAESNESLKTKGRTSEMTVKESKKTARKPSSFSASVERGHIGGTVSSGTVGNSVTCCSLQSGDIAILLDVSIGDDKIEDPVLEILQFEKFESSEVSSNYVSHRLPTDQDPYRDLLTWLIPVDRALPPPGLLPSPSLVSSPGISSASQKSSSSPLSGSQLFSFGHTRSYSMPAIPQASLHSSPVYPPANRKLNLGVEDFERFSSDGMIKKQDLGTEEILSFRGVPQEPERFSAARGVEGIYIPSLRWRKKLAIIQPIEIHSFAAECNTEDLLCVQVKNVSPENVPDIVMYIDAITIVFEEAPSDGSLYLPMSCIEAGSEYCFPDISLRRGEEHSFILKPASTTAINHNSCANKNPSDVQTVSKVMPGRRLFTSPDQYAILISCRCNYTESKLFFKKPTSWRPRFRRDLIVSVTSEISAQSLGPSWGSSLLPIQEMTLQATNLTEEDLTLAVLAPASFTSPPSVMSLNSSPMSPMTPRAGWRSSAVAAQQGKQDEEDGGEATSSSDDLGCSHLWLQSVVPLGCVPSRSSATVKLELLPLTDGIISLDTLQISAKEKGITYMPERPLKIYATSSIATGIS